MPHTDFSFPVGDKNPLADVAYEAMFLQELLQEVDDGARRVLEVLECKVRIQRAVLHAHDTSDGVRVCLYSDMRRQGGEKIWEEGRHDGFPRDLRHRMELEADAIDRAKHLLKKRLAAMSPAEIAEGLGCREVLGKKLAKDWFEPRPQILLGADMASGPDSTAFSMATPAPRKEDQYGSRWGNAIRAMFGANAADRPNEPTTTNFIIGQSVLA